MSLKKKLKKIIKKEKELEVNKNNKLQEDNKSLI